MYRGTIMPIQIYMQETYSYCGLAHAECESNAPATAQAVSKPLSRTVRQLP